MENVERNLKPNGQVFATTGWILVRLGTYEGILLFKIKVVLKIRKEFSNTNVYLKEKEI